MKIACLYLLASSTASAFTVTPLSPASAVASRSVTSLYAEGRPDSSKAVAAALEASKKFGATSPEARIAWEAVEDMDSSDNSAATKGSLEDECDISDEELSAKCMDYESKMAELKSIVGNFEMSKFDQMKALTNELSNIKVTVQSASQKDSPELKAAVAKAMAEAKKISDEKGADSPEAKVAWTEVEEIASSGLQNAVGARLDEECLVDTAQEACMALEELNRALSKVGITK